MSLRASKPSATLFKLAYGATDGAVPNISEGSFFKMRPLSRGAQDIDRDVPTNLSATDFQARMGRLSIARPQRQVRCLKRRSRTSGAASVAEPTLYRYLPAIKGRKATN